MTAAVTVPASPSEGPGPAPLPAPPAGMRGGPGPLLRVVKDQRLAFLVVGGINTLLGTAWFLAFHYLTGGWGGYLVTLLMAHVASVLCAFVLYRHLVFRVRGHVWLDLARFEVVNLSALAVNAALLPVFVELVGLPVVAAQLVVTLVSAVISYTGHRGFSFRRPRAAPVPEDPS